MRCIFLYLFICYLTTLIPLIEYTQRKENQIISKGSIIPKHPLINIFIYFIIIPLYKFALYKSYPLKRNRVPKISKKRYIEGFVCISLLAFNWYQTIKFLFD
jgi:hypothetical protein